ncbi:hypothetical protein, partial [Mesorhizobium sp.]|uniref:hypothetical protein n=1 Tax=Mesorhizobium sp. TaxID=1871066 RepID=UPI0025BCF258
VRSVIQIHRPMARPLMPDDLAEIRQFDDLIAGRTDIVVAALAKRRRSAAPCPDRRTGFRFPYLMKHDSSQFF